MKFKVQKRIRMKNAIISISIWEDEIGQGFDAQFVIDYQYELVTVGEKIRDLFIFEAVLNSGLWF